MSRTANRPDLHQTSSPTRSRWLGALRRVVVGLGIATGAIVGVAVAVVLFWLRALGDFRSRPSDAKLIKMFATHRRSFDQLEAMADTDSRFDRITPSFTRPDTSVLYSPPGSIPFVAMPAARLNRYRAAFDSLAIDGGIERESSGDTVTVFLIAFSQGMVNRGSSEGYLFSRTPMSPMYPALDGPSVTQHARHGGAFRLIAPNWYLAYYW